VKAEARLEQLDSPVREEGRAIELAYRESSHLSVALLWNREGGTLTVSVRDVEKRDDFDVIVRNDKALDAFYHPFAYAGVRGSRD
jgi:hypothetical protein